MTLRTIPAPRPAPDIFFDPRELDAILSVYGRMVAQGEWRDYAIGGADGLAVFCIYRRATEMPLYRIEKRPGPARRQGMYTVLSMGGHVLKRGHDLSQVLRIFDRMMLRVVGD